MNASETPEKQHTFWQCRNNENFECQHCKTIARMHILCSNAMEPWRKDRELPRNSTIYFWIRNIDLGYSLLHWSHNAFERIKKTARTQQCVFVAMQKETKRYTKNIINIFQKKVHILQAILLQNNL